MKSVVIWQGAGRYAWRIDENVQRWFKVGYSNMPLPKSLNEAAQRGLTGMTWAEHPDDLHVDEVEESNDQPCDAE